MPEEEEEEEEVAGGALRGRRDPHARTICCLLVILPREHMYARSIAHGACSVVFIINVCRDYPQRKNKKRECLKRYRLLFEGTCEPL